MIMHDFTLERKKEKGKKPNDVALYPIGFPSNSFSWRIWVSDLHHHHHENSEATFLAALKMQPRVLSQSFYCEIEK